MGKTRIYLSGAITSVGVSRAMIRFEEARKDLTFKGFEVISPFDNGLPTSAPYEEHMKKDLEMLNSCDAICMLKGWEKSKGAKLEYETAKAQGKIIYYQKRQ